MDRRATDIKEGDLVDVGHHKRVKVRSIAYGHAVVDIEGRIAQFRLEHLRKCDMNHRSESEDDIT